MRTNPAVRAGIGAAFVFVRCLERIFSPRTLRRVLSPCIAFRVAFMHTRPVFKMPECLGDGAFQVTQRQRRKNYLNSALEFFPEQLGTPKWRDRLQLTGAEYLESARKKNRPVVLAFWHSGPYFLMRYWLRAAGFPASTLVEGRSQNRKAMKRWKDSVSPFPEIPIAFHREDELRETLQFLATGNPLLIAVDVLTGKQMDVPVDEHWKFGMANGAVRMAMRRGAELIPCSIVETDTWRFQIRLGPPVPASVMASRDAVIVGKHLLDAMLPALREYPEQCTGRLFKQFRRAEPKNNYSDGVPRVVQTIAG
jgi:lauroyl/myristoyl acyltransferase